MTPTVTCSNACLLLASVTVLVAAGRDVSAQAIKRSPSGFNLFTVEQDIELGRQAATAIEPQLHPVTSPRTERFLTGVASLLASHAPTPAYAYVIRAVNAAEWNAFVLPGGTIYVSHRLLGLSRSEGEVAGLLAHSMAHVLLRHGTERVSRAYLEKAGLVALGGLGPGTGTASRVVSAVGGFGPGGAFLDFDLTDEYEADALGAELMAKAGYEAVAMASMFAVLRREHRRNPAMDRFFRSHPAPPDREYRIRNLSNVLGHGRGEVVGGFSTARLRAGRTVVSAATNAKVSGGSVEPAPTPLSFEGPPPSSTFLRFSRPDSTLAVDHPENWDVYPSGFAVSFAPDGGIVEAADREPNLLLGAVVNYYAPFEGAVDRWNNSLKRHFAPFDDRTRQRGGLEDATDDLVRQILDIQPWLSAPNNSARSESYDGTRGYSVRLTGRSPLTGATERVTVYTRALPDEHVVYLACVSPASTRTAVERACARMARSLQVNDAVVHRQ